MKAGGMSSAFARLGRSGESARHFSRFALPGKQGQSQNAALAVTERRNFSPGQGKVSNQLLSAQVPHPHIENGIHPGA
jgi:hypothetical protein